MTQVNRILLLAALVMSAGAPLAAQAVSQPQWAALPAACLPNRAVEWDSNKSANQQAPCSCPPKSLCPSTAVDTMQEFFEENRTMPDWLVLHCKCPLPTCPSGTDFEGSPLPDDGNCNCPSGTTLSNGKCALPTCPSGTDFEGSPLPDDGNCNCPPGTTLSNTELNRQCVVEPPPPPSDGGGDSGAGAGDGGDCLRSDSVVELIDGQRVPISDITLGDRLKGPDGDAEVVQINHLQGQALFYRINGLAFAITGDHPIRTTEGWKSVDDIGRYSDIVIGRLEVGNTMITQNGQVQVTSIEIEMPKQGTRSVNIRTADGRAFFVDGVAVKPFKDINFIY